MGDSVFVNFGKALLARRKELKLSQEEFGDRVGLSRATLSNLENGYNGPSDSTLLRLEQEFGMDRQHSLELLGRVGASDRQSSAMILEEIAALPDHESRMARWATLSPKARLGALLIAQDMQRETAQQLQELIEQTSRQEPGRR